MSSILSPIPRPRRTSQQICCPMYIPLSPITRVIPTEIAPLRRGNSPFSDLLGFFCCSSFQAEITVFDFPDSCLMRLPAFSSGGRCGFSARGDKYISNSSSSLVSLVQQAPVPHIVIARSAVPLCREESSISTCGAPHSVCAALRRPCTGVVRTTPRPLKCTFGCTQWCSYCRALNPNQRIWAE